MIIVSQDKDLIVNFDNVTVIGIAQSNSKEIDSITVNGEEQYLAEYKTKERAKEVLQMIIKEYKKVLTTFNRGTGQQRFYDLPKVYYMPED